jgi:hypothetical protein
MDRPASVEGLVVAGWVDGQSAEELTLLGHDSNLIASHEEVDGFVPVSGSGTGSVTTASTRPVRLR